MIHLLVCDSIKELIYDEISHKSVVHKQRPDTLQMKEGKLIKDLLDEFYTIVYEILMLRLMRMTKL